MTFINSFTVRWQCFLLTSSNFRQRSFLSQRSSLAMMMVKFTVTPKERVHTGCREKPFPPDRGQNKTMAESGRVHCTTPLYVFFGSVHLCFACRACSRLERELELHWITTWRGATPTKSLLGRIGKGEERGRRKDSRKTEVCLMTVCVYWHFSSKGLKLANVS